MSERLDAGQFSHIRVIYNPRSGTRRIEKAKAQLEAGVTRQLGAGVLELSPTAGPGDAVRLSAEAAQRWGKECLVVLAGGDGSAGEAAQGLSGTDTPLLVLPFGSGNDFSRTIYRGQSRDPVDILQAAGLVPDPSRTDAGLLLEPIDLLRAEADSYELPPGEIDRPAADGTMTGKLDRYVLNVISIGYDSTVAIEANRLRRRWAKLGSTSYAIGVITQAAHSMEYAMQLGWRDEHDVQRSEDKDYSVCAVCNASYYGGGFQPNPAGRLNDGLIDVVISRPIKIWDIVKMARQYRRGDIESIDILNRYQGSTFTFKAAADPLKITLDGEGFYCPELRVTAQPGSLLLALPAPWGLPRAVLPR